jgi:hypothetical protein
MSHLSRSVLGVPVKFLVPVVVAACCTVAASWRGAEFWSAAPAEDESDAEALRGGEPSQEIGAVMSRIRRKEAFAEGVIKGRVTLLEAAAAFRVLDEAPPRFHWDEFRAAYPGADDDERHCREVIGYVNTWLVGRGYESGWIVRRLEAELQGHIDRGDLRLPAVVAAAPVAPGQGVTP